MHSSRLFERIGVALQKGNTQGILDFRYKEVDVPEYAEYYAVIGAHNTKLLSLANCDAYHRVVDVTGDNHAILVVALEKMSVQTVRICCF